MDKPTKTFFDLINHNITIGIVIVGVILWVNAGDKPNNDSIIKLQTRQDIIAEQLDKIENNHLAHIQLSLNELLVQVTKLAANQEILLNTK